MQTHIYETRVHFKNKLFSFGFSLALLACPVHLPCAHRTDLVGGCFWVRGSLDIWNGWQPNIRISIRNSERMLGIATYDEEGSEIVVAPRNVEDAISWDHSLVGNWHVCPLREWYQIPTGYNPWAWIRDVCIETAKFRVEKEGVLRL